MGQFIKFHPSPSYNLQKIAVENSPYNIEFIKEPDKRIVQEVATHIQGLQDNPRYAYYFNSEYRESHSSNSREYSQTQNTNTLSENASHEESQLFSSYDNEFDLEMLA